MRTYYLAEYAEDYGNSYRKFASLNDAKRTNPVAVFCGRPSKKGDLWEEICVYTRKQKSPSTKRATTQSFQE
jgi:hypothetical protein